jgi:Carboxypeptidase regulatory-like domain/Bacterial Ig-like domain (group 2)
MTSVSLKSIGTFAALFAVSVFFTACANNPASPTIPAPVVVVPAATVSSVQVTSVPSSNTSYQLTAIARSSDGSSQDVTAAVAWLSSNLQLATVTSTGHVAVVGTGNVDLSATFHGVSGTVRLSVTQPPVFTLSGVVREAGPGGLPIVGARVQNLTGGDHALSDGQGGYTLTGLTAGETIIEVTSAGYQTWSNEITVVNSGTLDIAMSPAAPSVGAAGHSRI